MKKLVCYIMSFVIRYIISFVMCYVISFVIWKVTVLKKTDIPCYL